MKKFLILASFLTLSTMAQAQDSWWNSLLNSVGLGDDTAAEVPAAPSLNGMVENLTSALGVTPEQAQGGLAALFNFAKQNVSQEQFDALASQIPGLDSVMQYLPAIAAASEGGLGGLIDKAAGMNESLGQINNLKKQFDTLGLDTSMIQQYTQQASSYLDTPEGQEAKSLLSESLLGLTL
jgi:hypothetical protein